MGSLRSRSLLSHGVLRISIGSKVLSINTYHAFGRRVRGDERPPLPDWTTRPRLRLARPVFAPSGTTPEVFSRNAGRLWLYRRVRGRRSSPTRSISGAQGAVRCGPRAARH